MPNCWRQYRLLTPSLPRARPTFGWWFDEPLDVGKSSVEVRDPAGAVIAEGNVLDDDPDTMMAVLPVLAPGTFEVRWTAGSADGHLVRGTYTFTVEAAPKSDAHGFADADARAVRNAVPVPFDITQRRARH
jgi:hypothetical protein